MMRDERRAEFRKRMMLRLFSSPAALVPFVVGMTVFMVAWALSLAQAALALFASLCCIVLGIGSLMTRVLFGMDALGERVATELQEEAQERRQKLLDRLERELVDDGDDRTQGFLRDLRELTASFAGPDESEASWSASGVSVVDSYVLKARVCEIFDEGVRALERSLQLWKTADGLSSEAAREKLLEQRADLIEDVGRTITYLAELIGRLQTMAIEEDTDGSRTKLVAFQGEIDEYLNTKAAAVRELKSWTTGGVSGKDEEAFLRAAEQQNTE